MDKLLLQYSFDRLRLCNPDGTLAADAAGCTLVRGPGATDLGQFSRALHFGGVGAVQVELPENGLSLRKFCVRTLFRVEEAVTRRQDLFESGVAGISIHLAPAFGNPGRFHAAACVAPKAHGPAAASTQYSGALTVGQWYSLDLLYDQDTLGLAIDGGIASVVAFPRGQLEATSTELCIGTDRIRIRPFRGSIAALQVHEGLPLHLEALLDEKRGTPEWFITHKYHGVKSDIGIGTPAGPVVRNATLGCYEQPYTCGLIMYSDTAGACEMHGAVHALYQQLGNKERLGHLVSDEMAASVAGSRKSLFTKGAIYWSAGNGAIPVLGQIHLDYAAMNDASWIGLPVAPASNLASGTEQRFELGRMYHRRGQPRAFGVHGPILERYLATGGVNVWGYPTSNEHDVRSNGTIVGRASDFESCTFYSKPGLGAFEVHGAIRDAYRAAQGATGTLGFPTSNEVDVPCSAAPARASTFEYGSILRFGSGEPVVCRRLKVRIGRIVAREPENMSACRSGHHLRVRVEQNGHQLLNQRYPESGDFGSLGSLEVDRDLPIVLSPTDLHSIIELTFDISTCEEGVPFERRDGRIRSTRVVLEAANAWGLCLDEHAFTTGGDETVESIEWSIFQDVDAGALTEEEKWWGPCCGNRSTPSLTYAQYGSAFREVDRDPEWRDWLEKPFYELVIERIAAGGNCFGMALEAVYSRKRRSLLSVPLNRFDNWTEISSVFNLRQQYQVGSSAVWWFASQFLSGESNAPADIFARTRDALARGDDPLVCVTQNYDFSGSPHCLLVVGHDDSSTPWKLEVRDPDVVKGDLRRFIEIDPRENTFRYCNGSRTYAGAEWNGGRLYYVPYSVLGERPQSATWHTMLLAVSGALFLIGNDVETVSVRDTDGTDLNVFGSDAVARLRKGQSVAQMLVPLRGCNGDGAIDSELYLKTRPQASPSPPATGDSAIRHVLRGRRSGALSYTVRDRLTTHRIVAPIDAGETATITTCEIDSRSCVAALRSSSRKLVRFDLDTRLGIGGDHLEVAMERLPIRPGRDLQFFVQPALGGIDVIGIDAGSQPQVRVSGLLGGRKFQGSYTLPYDGGLRIRPSTIASSGDLKVGRIDALFGPLRESRLLKSQ
jgi:hypothetical protein